MATQTEHVYVERDDAILSGEPVIKGTRTPVRAVVELWRLGCAPEETVNELPHLSLAAVSMRSATTATTKKRSTTTSSATEYLTSRCDSPLCRGVSGRGR